jgi:large subunit ribosomal protein L31e
MAKKDTAPKMEYEREYIVPLRKGWLKVPPYKRGNKAVKTLKEFIARHMKVYDRDLRKIKVEVDLNNEIRFRGMTKPPAKIKVKAKKFDNDTVSVELVDLPKHIEFKRMREKKKKVSGKTAPEIKPAKEVKKDIEKAVEETKSKTKDKKKDTKKEITEKTKK